MGSALHWDDPPRTVQRCCPSSPEPWAVQKQWMLSLNSGCIISPNERMIVSGFWWLSEDPITLAWYSLKIPSCFPDFRNLCVVFWVFLESCPAGLQCQCHPWWHEEMVASHPGRMWKQCPFHYGSQTWRTTTNAARWALWNLKTPQWHGRTASSGEVHEDTIWDRWNLIVHTI